MGEEIKTFRDLIAWQRAMELVTQVYEATKKFPKEEVYGMVSQMRRCAVSIPSNIAEGYGRRATNDYIRFLNIAASSLYELQTQVQISANLRYIEESHFDALFESSREVERILWGLIRSLERPGKTR